MFPTKTLWDDGFLDVIDPVQGQIIYGTFYHAGTSNYLLTCEISSPFVVWVAGMSDSAVVTTPDALEPDYPGGTYNDYLAKLNLNTNQTVYCTYLPGTGHQYIHDFQEVDDAIYLLGLMGTSAFPTTPGVFDQSGPGEFLLHFALPDTMIAATFLRGFEAFDLSISPSGSVALAGVVNDSFPVTVGAFDSTIVNIQPESDAEGLFLHAAACVGTCPAR